MAMDDCPSTDEVIDLNDKKKKRYPADRQKLHALLDKKEQDLLELQEEVAELRRLVQQADRTAIHTTCELYNVTPEQLAAFFKAQFGQEGMIVPQLPEGATVAPALSEYDVMPKEDAPDEDV